MSLSTDAANRLNSALASNSAGAEIVALLNGSQGAASTFTGGLTVTTANMTINDVDIVLSATTGTKIGTATTQKLGFYNATPIVQPSAYTQTAYATADKTVANITTTSPSTTLILTATNIAAKTASLTLTDAVATNAGTVAVSLDQAQKDIGTAFNTLRVEVAALVADLADVKQALNSVIDDLQVLGLAG